MQWENVHIFISSTFNDMHAERDYLIKNVFPALSEWCEERKLRLIDIDLRWGVSEADATQNKRVVQVCLDRIDECRPFFLCFLGQRRGWVPSEVDVSENTITRFPGLRNRLGSSSVTEMEILHALIDPLHNGTFFDKEGKPRDGSAAEHAFFFLRSPSYLKDLSGDLSYIYTNKAEADPSAADLALAKWREAEIPGTGRPVHDYTASWNPDESTPEIALPLAVPTTAPQNSGVWANAFTNWRKRWASAGVTVDESGKITGAELEKAKAYNRELTVGRLCAFQCGGKPLAEIIIEELKDAIKKRFPKHMVVREETPQQKELDQQAQFLERNLAGFIERAGALASLNAYADGDMNITYALTAQAGMGKSMLLANFAFRRSKSERTVVRFIGASDNSTDIAGLWRGIFAELGIVAPSSPDALFTALPSLLAEAGRSEKTLIILDGLNQLDTGLSAVHGLPRLLPPGVRLVVSFRDDIPGGLEAADYLRGKGAIAERLPPFDSEDDRKAVITAYLNQYLKDLDDAYIRAICIKPAASNPLFLKVLLSELRVFGSFSELGETIRTRFGDTTETAFDAMLSRYETDAAYGTIAPEKAVPVLFGLLATARRGLSEAELTYCLREEFYKETEPRIHDTIHFFLRQAQPFLARRENRVDFLYESFAVAARSRYAVLANRFHTLLTRCFSAVCDPSSDGTYEADDARSLTELAWHTMKLNARAGESLYRSLAYLNARCSSGGTFALLSETRDFTDERINTWREIIMRYAEELDAFPNALFSIVKHNDTDKLRRDADDLIACRKWRRPWLETALAFEPAECSPIMQSALRIVPEAVSNFEKSVASCFSLNRDILFVTDGLGRIRLFRTNVWVPDDYVIDVRRVRVLKLLCSGNGSLLLAAYDDASADLLTLSYNTDGTLSRAEKVAEFRFLLPLYEDPVFAFYGDELWYQEDERSILRTGPAGTARYPLHLPGELAAAAFIESGAYFALRVDDGTLLVKISGAADQMHTVIPGVMAVCMTEAPGHGVALALSDGCVALFDGKLTRLDAFKVEQPPVALCAYSKGLFVYDHDRSYLWDEPGAAVQPVDTESLPMIRMAALKPEEGGSILFLSDRTVARFRPKAAEDESAVSLIAMFEENHGGLYTLLHDGSTLYALHGNERVGMGAFSESELLGVLHKPGEIAVVNRNSKSIVLSTRDLSVSQADFKAYAASPESIAACEYGYYFFEPGGRIQCRQSGTGITIRPTIDHSHFRGCKMSFAAIRVSQRLFILCGAESGSLRGEETSAVALFFELLPNGSLRQLGERLFPERYGSFITMTVDGDVCYFLFAAPSTTLIAPCTLVFGSASALMDGGGEEHRLMLRRSRTLMVCKYGTLYISAGDSVCAYDAESLSYKCAVFSDARFDGIAQTAPNASAIFVKEGKNRVFYLRAHN